MHLYGYLLRFLPPPLSGILFAAIYAGLIVLLIFMWPLTPANFDYGRY